MLNVRGLGKSAWSSGDAITCAAPHSTAQHGTIIIIIIIMEQQQLQKTHDIPWHQPERPTTCTMPGNVLQ